MSSVLIDTQHAADPPKSPAALRILLAKVGLDGHDRGIKVVARGLREAGFHVIYGGIWQSPEAVAQAALDEDADWLGLSLLNGAHMSLMPRVIDAIRASGNQRTRCLLGGIVPTADVSLLKEMGVASVFGPGTSINSICEFLNTATTTAADNAQQLIQASRAGDRPALSRLLTLISRGGISPDDIGPVASKPSPRTVAITGSAGVGKSSVIARLTRQLCERGKRVAVLACDPQSPVSGGALLGDRVRMIGSDASAPNLLIRSLAVPSGQQGIAANIEAMSLALHEFGFDLVLVESVGVGQGDVAVKQHTDKVIMLLQPESGDSVQWEKAGLLEVADLVVINKSDLPGADRLESELKQHLNLPGYRDVPIVRVSAVESQGFDALCDYVDQASSTEVG